jgi:Phage gp6-like head-tail connector protein
MATWPTLDEVRAVLRLEPSPSEDPLIERARLAAVDYVEGRIDPKWVLIDPLGPIIPDGVYEATLFAAARYYRRRDSLDGTIGWGDTGVVRVGRYDPDVDALLGRYLALVIG